MKRCCDCKFYYRGWKWLWTPMCLHKESTDRITGGSPHSCHVMRGWVNRCDGSAKYYEEKEERLTDYSIYERAR